MTEAEWLTGSDPILMLMASRGATSDRKRRLFGAACCRRKWKYFTDERARRAVETAEAFADGGGTLGDLDGAGRRVLQAVNGWRAKQGNQSILVRVCSAARALVQSQLYVGEVIRDLAGIPVNSARARAAEARQQCALLRDVVGNPLNPTALDPSWQTPTVHALARQMYESHDFSPMPILADALQEAGCEHPDILTHCRSDGPHARGCWVIDLVLGLEMDAVPQPGDPLPDNRRFGEFIRRRSPVA